MTIFGLDQSDLWDDIIRSFPNYDIYYLSGYARTLKVHGDGEPVMLYYEKDGARGACVLLIRDVATDPHLAGLVAPGVYYDASTPYGYGGFIFDGDVDTESVRDEFNSALAERNINSVFFRFHPVLNNAADNRPLSKIVTLGNTIAMDLSSPETIWNNLTRTCRNRVRKATKSGVVISHSDDPNLFVPFKDLYYRTMKVRNADSYYYFKDDFFNAIATHLKGHYQIFYSTYDGKIISAALMIYANNQVHYHLGGLLREYRTLASVNLLFYRAALWGYEQGFKTMHLGGGFGACNDSLYKFKSTFNRNASYQYTIGMSVIDVEVYNKLLSLRNINKYGEAVKRYFPLYRAK